MTTIYNPFEFSLSDPELKTLGVLFLTWSHTEHLIGDCLKGLLGLSSEDAIKQVHDISFNDRMIKLRGLKDKMNDDAKAAFELFDSSFEYLQALRNLVAHCILIDSDEGTLFHVRSKDRTLSKTDIFESE